MARAIHRLNASQAKAAPERRHTGSINGRFILSHREAAALSVHRNTVGPWFAQLTQRGVIWMAEAPYLGPSGIGLASVWGLEEVPLTEGGKPGRAFMSWRKETDRPVATVVQFAKVNRQLGLFHADAG